MSKDIGVSPTGPGSQASPAAASASAPSVSIPNAGDFERWGMLTRNPAPDAAHGVGVSMQIIIRADGTVQPKHLCDHAGWAFAKHGRCCPACGLVMLDFGD